MRVIARLRRGGLPAALLLAGTLSAATMPAVRAADLPTAMTCTFKDGGAWALEKQGFAPKSVQALAIGISGIDRPSMTARLDRQEGLAILRMVQAVDALHFIEVGVEGYLNLTTIYERQSDGTHPAVHSRHVAVLGEPMVSQYRGSCTSK